MDKTETTPATPEQTIEDLSDIQKEPVETSAPTEQEQLFTDCNETMYATTTVNVRSSYSTNSDKLGSLTKAQSVKRTGIGTGAATKPQVSTGNNGGSSSGQTSKPSSKPSTGSSSSSGSSGSSGSGSTAPVPPGGSGSSGGSNIGDLDMGDLNDWFNDESQSGTGGPGENFDHGFDPVDTQ